MVTRSSVKGNPSLSITVLFIARFIRLLAFGAIAPIFFTFCLELQIDEFMGGALLTGMMLGDLLVTLNLTTRADAQLGRRFTLVFGALLMAASGFAFGCTNSFWVLLMAGAFGVISTNGGEIGPFLPCEHACLAEAITCKYGEYEANKIIPSYFGYYNCMGYFAQASGALLSGVVIQVTKSSFNFDLLTSYRCIYYGYGVLGLSMAMAYCFLGKEVEPTHPTHAMWTITRTEAREQTKSSCMPNIHVGLKRRKSKYIVARLSALFCLDAFAGSFVMYTWISLWFNVTFKYDAASLGYLICGCLVVSGISGMFASALVNRFGAINTMVFTHLPSNVILLAIPFLPDATSAAVVLIIRFCISNIDVPARQAYIAMSVTSEERSAAAGITTVFRSIGTSIGPIIVGYLSQPDQGKFWFDSPWIIGGVLEIVYDVLLFYIYHYSEGFKEAEKSIAAQNAAVEQIYNAHKDERDEPLSEPFINDSFLSQYEHLYQVSHN